MLGLTAITVLCRQGVLAEPRKRLVTFHSKYQLIFIRKWLLRHHLLRRKICGGNIFITQYTYNATMSRKFCSSFHNNTFKVAE